MVVRMPNGLGGVHLAVGLAADRVPLLGTPRQFRDLIGDRVRAGARCEASPEERVFYLRSIVSGWFTFSVLCGFLMVALAWLGDQVAGNHGRNTAIAVGAAGVVFCLSGGVYATWKLLYAVLAKMRLRAADSGDVRFRRYARRSEPTSRSLIPQGLAGVATLLVLAVTLH
jgi:hypothetical protein